MTMISMICKNLVQGMLIEKDTSFLSDFCKGFHQFSCDMVNQPLSDWDCKDFGTTRLE